MISGEQIGMRQLPGQLDVGIDPVLRHRMLVPVKVQLLQHASDCKRFLIDVIGAPGVVHQYHVVADRFANQPADLDVLLDVRWTAGNRCLCYGIPVIVWMDLVGEIALLFAGERVLGVVLRRAHVWIGAGVRFHPVSAAAHQLVDGDAGRVSGQIPEHHINDADHIFGRFRRPEPLPDPLAIVRIHPDQQRFHPAEDVVDVPLIKPILIAMSMPAEIAANTPAIGMNRRQ